MTISNARNENAVDGGHGNGSHNYLYVRLIIIHNGNSDKIRNWVFVTLKVLACSQPFTSKLTTLGSNWQLLSRFFC